MPPPSPSGSTGGRRCGASTTPASGPSRSATLSCGRCDSPAACSASSCATARAARRLAEATRLFTLAESLGAVESLIELPAAMTHLSVAGLAAGGAAGAGPALGRHRGRRGPARRPRGRRSPHRRRDRRASARGRADRGGRGNDGELVERLSGGTATLLLVWLIGVGRPARCSAAWLFGGRDRPSGWAPASCFGGRALHRPVRRHRPTRALARRPCPGPVAAGGSSSPPPRSAW